MFPLTAETGRLLVESEEGRTRTINQLISIFRIKNNNKDVLKENSILKNHSYFESPNSSVITTSSQRDDHTCEVIKIALLYANANQLCTLFVHKDKSWMYEISFFLLIVCIILQVVMGVGVILKGQMNSRGRRVEWVDDYLVGTVLIITVFNVLAATFTICDTPTSIEVEKPSA